MTDTVPRPASPVENPEGGLRERKKQATHTAMHRAALELVAEHGLGGVTVEMIARRAGVSTRTFFNHWATKEAAILGIRAEGRTTVIAGLREALGAGLAPHQAVRDVLRDAVASVPADSELRTLKKQVMEREPRLQSISSGNLLETQTEMVDVLAEALEGPDAEDRAVLTVQLGFALIRSAVGISMRTGDDVLETYDRVLDLYDTGAVQA